MYDVVFMQIFKTFEQLTEEAFDWGCVSKVWKPRRYDNTLTQGELDLQLI